MRTSLAVSAAALLLSAAAPSRADWPAEGDTLFRYYTRPSFMRVAVDQAGGIGVGLRLVMGSAPYLRSYRVAADGTPFVDWDPTSSLAGEITFDGVGGAFKTRATPTGFNLHRLLPTGGPDPAWPAGGLVVTSDPYNEPVLAPDDSGGAHVAATVGYTSVVAWRFRPDGSMPASWPAGGRVIRQLAGENYKDVASVPDGSHGSVAAWTTYGGAGLSIMAQRVLPDGSFAWSPAAGKELTTPGASHVAVLGMHVSGDAAYVCWGNELSPTSREVRLQRVMLADGSVASGWPAAGIVIATGDPATIAARLYGDGSDGALITWVDGPLLRGVRITNAATPAAGWSGAGQSLLDAAGSLAPLPAPAGVVAVSAAGYVVVWGDGRDAGESRLRARWLLPDGSADPSQPDEGIEVASGTRASPYGAAGDGAGGAYVAWAHLTWPTGSEYNSFMLSRVEYANTVGVSPSPRGATALEAWPNPARDGLLVRFSLSDDAPATIQLIDVAGRVHTRATVRGARQHTWTFDRVDALPAGVCFVRLVHGRDVSVTRVAVIH